MTVDSPYQRRTELFNRLITGAHWMDRRLHANFAIAWCGCLHSMRTSYSIFGEFNLDACAQLFRFFFHFVSSSSASSSSSSHREINFFSLRFFSVSRLSRQVYFQGNITKYPFCQVKRFIFVSLVHGMAFVWDSRVAEKFTSILVTPINESIYL